MTYSRVYKNIKSEAIEMVKQLPKQGLWKKDVDSEVKIKLIEEFLEKISKLYNVPVPNFVFLLDQGEYDITGGGGYISSKKQITMYLKFSLVTLLHEFRHHVQYNSNIKIYKEDLEEDARAWSVSLFRAACPKSYRNAVEKGLLHFN